MLAIVLFDRVLLKNVFHSLINKGRWKKVIRAWKNCRTHYATGFHEKTNEMTMQNDIISINLFTIILKREITHFPRLMIF